MMETEPEPSDYDESDQDSNDPSDGATHVEIQDESPKGAASVEMQDESPNVADNVEITTGTPPGSHWNEIVARNIKEYLVHGKYPSDLPSSESVKRRNFRKRAKDFMVKNDNLYYIDKKSKLRLAIYSKEEQERVF